VFLKSSPAKNQASEGKFSSWRA